MGVEIMRKYINNKLYDTQSAVCIFKRKSEGLNKNHIAYEEVAIYRKKQGEYFLYNYRGLKADIVPLSYEQAVQYVQTYGSVDEFNKAFSVSSAEGNTSIRVVVPKSVKKKLDIICSQRGITQTEFIENCINQYYGG